MSVGAIELRGSESPPANVSKRHRQTDAHRTRISMRITPRSLNSLFKETDKTGDARAPPPLAGCSVLPTCPDLRRRRGIS